MGIKILLLLVLVYASLAQITPINSTKKGMTWSVISNPTSANSWTAKVGCSGCNTTVGDQLCTLKFPVLCVINYKTIYRPFYSFPASSGAAITDNGFYNGWSGGLFAATKTLVPGVKLYSRAVASQICAAQYGPTAQVAEYSMGYYMRIMNLLPNVGITWNWATATTGKQNLWGYVFSPLPAGRMWTWINNSTANCY